MHNSLFSRATNYYINIGTSSSIFNIFFYNGIFGSRKEKNPKLRVTLHFHIYFIIAPSGLEPPTGARNRSKATVKILRNMAPGFIRIDPNGLL